MPQQGQRFGQMSFNEAVARNNQEDGSQGVEIDGRHLNIPANMDPQAAIQQMRAGRKFPEFDSQDAATSEGIRQDKIQQIILSDRAREVLMESARQIQAKIGSRGMLRKDGAGTPAFHSTNPEGRRPSPRLNQLLNDVRQQPVVGRGETNEFVPVKDRPFTPVEDRPFVPVIER